MFRSVLHVAAIRRQSPVLLQVVVHLPVIFRESKLLGDVDFLATGELELGTPQSLDDLGLETVARSHTHDWLADVDPRDGALRLAEGPAHPGLEPIGPSARQHLVDADHVEGVQPHADVELVFSAVLDQVFVGANTPGFQRLGAELFIFVGDQVDAQGEVVDGGFFLAEVEDADLGVGDAAAETRFRVGFVLAVAIAGKRGFIFSVN